MKQTIIFLLSLFITFTFTNCSNSNDDNSNSTSLTQTEQKLIGKWNTSQNLTGNTYQYKTDKTAIYTNTWTNGTQTEVTVYNGAWAIINGNVLIEYYPDTGETWNNNWQQNPTLKNKLEFVNDNTLKLTDYYNSTHINTHYKMN